MPYIPLSDYQPPRRFVAGKRYKVSQEAYRRIAKLKDTDDVPFWISRYDGCIVHVLGAEDAQYVGYWYEPDWCVEAGDET